MPSANRYFLPGYEDTLRREMVVREGRWSEAITIRNLSFIEQVKSELGFKAPYPDSREFNPFNR